MIKVEVESAPPRRVAGTSGRTGKQYEFFTQVAWASIPGEKYPQKVEITVRSAAEAYQAGEYVVDPRESFYVRNNRLEFRPVLCSKAAAATKAA